MYPEDYLTAFNEENCKAIGDQLKGTDWPSELELGFTNHARWIITGRVGYNR